MLETFLALAPIFLLIAIGWALKALWLRDEAMWRPAEKLAYFVLIPALVVHDLYNADLASLPFSRMVIALLGAVIIVALVLLALRPLLSRILVEGDVGFTSVFQGSIRANFFITLAAAPVLLPADGAALVIIAVAFFTVTANIFAVLVLARWGRDGRADRLSPWPRFPRPPHGRRGRCESAVPDVGRTVSGIVLRNGCDGSVDRQYALARRHRRRRAGWQLWCPVEGHLHRVWHRCRLS